MVRMERGILNELEQPNDVGGLFGIGVCDLGMCRVVGVERSAADGGAMCIVGGLSGRG